MKVRAGLLIILGCLVAIITFFATVFVLVNIFGDWAFGSENLVYNLGQLLFVTILGYFSYWLLKKGMQLVN